MFLQCWINFTNLNKLHYPIYVGIAMAAHYYMYIPVLYSTSASLVWAEYKQIMHDNSSHRNLFNLVQFQIAHTTKYIMLVIWAGRQLHSALHRAVVAVVVCAIIWGKVVIPVSNWIDAAPSIWKEPIWLHTVGLLPQPYTIQIARSNQYKPLPVFWTIKIIWNRLWTQGTQKRIQQNFMNLMPHQDQGHSYATDIT